MILVSYGEMKFLLTIQHNYVIPHWRDPDEHEDPERL